MTVLHKEKIGKCSNGMRILIAAGGAGGFLVAGREAGLGTALATIGFLAFTVFAGFFGGIVIRCQ